MGGKLKIRKYTRHSPPVFTAPYSDKLTISPTQHPLQGGGWVHMQYLKAIPMLECGTASRRGSLPFPNIDNKREASAGFLFLRHTPTLVHTVMQCRTCVPQLVIDHFPGKREKGDKDNRTRELRGKRNHRQ